MQDQYDEIGEILARFPEITSGDEQVLKEWLDKNEANRKIFEELTSTGHLLNMVKRIEQIEAGKKARWQRVLDTINQEDNIPQARKNIFWFRWQAFAAAASVIIIASVFLYLWQSNKVGKAVVQEPAVATANEVQPGEYKAKLTLDDGSTIILDSAKKGQLVQQGGLIVLNKDGKLIYEKGGATNKVLYNTLTTLKAETYVTELSDGTKVWLNAQSSIRYPVSFNGDVRKVEITGEAYFEVAPSVALLSNGQKGTRPFVVEVNGMEVEVLGTHFNINSYSDEEAIKTTLLEGKVKVGIGNQPDKEQSVILKPGEQAIVYSKSQTSFIPVQTVDVETEVAWRFGLFQFNHADLKTVMRQLERWYDVQVVYEGNVQHGEFEFLGKLPRNMKLSQVLSILQKQDVHFRLVDKKIVVTP